MANPVTKLTALLKSQFEAFSAQLFTAMEKRYVSKNPVTDLAELKALTVPENGETRQVESYLPEIVRYTFNTANTTDGETCDDGTIGRWNTLDLEVDAGEPWKSGAKYGAGEIFTFETTLTTAVDASGNPIKENVLNIGQYVNAAGDPVATTAGASLNLAELAKIELTAGSSEQRDQSITQAETDAVFLVD